MRRPSAVWCTAALLALQIYGCGGDTSLAVDAGSAMVGDSGSPQETNGNSGSASSSGTQDSGTTGSVDNTGSAGTGSTQNGTNTGSAGTNTGSVTGGTGSSNDVGTSSSTGGESSTGTNGSSTGESGGSSGGDATGTTGGDSTGTSGGDDDSICGGAPTLVVASAGGQVASGDGRTFVISFAPNALTKDTVVKVCRVAPDKVPSVIDADGAGPVMGVYRIEPETLPLAAGAKVTSVLTLSNEALQTITRGAEIAPLLLRTAVEGAAAPTTLAATEMRGAFPVSAALRGVHALGGYVYARHLDPAGIRHFARVVPATKTSVLTGELIRLGLKVSVSETPTAALQLGVHAVGCDLEPVAFSGSERPLTRDEPFACNEEVVEWANAEVVAGGATLSTGAVVDLTVGGADVDATHTPPTFVCTHPGPARAEVQVRFFAAGEATPLTTLVATQDFACSWSGDRIVVANLATAARIAHGPITPTLMPFGAPLPVHDISFTNDAHRQAMVAIGADGFYYKGLDATRSEKPFASLKLKAPNNTATATGADYESVAFSAAPIASKESADPNAARIDVQYFPSAGGSLRVEGATSSAGVEVNAAAGSEVDATFGEPHGTGTDLSFADGSADTIYIRGVIREGGSATGAIQPDGFVRWLRASDLLWEGGRRWFSILTDDQAQAIIVAEIPITHYQVAFLKTRWDEARQLWPAGRAVPVAAGVVYQVAASDLTGAVTGPCPPSVVVGPEDGCVLGHNELLAVAVGRNIELFNPVDGRFVRTFFSAPEDSPDGFVHVAQSQLDYCIYAAQQSASFGHGIWQYTTNGMLISDVSLIEDTSLTVAGLLAGGPDLFAANEQGGIVKLDMSTRPATISARLDVSSRARGITTRTDGALYFSDVGADTKDGRIRHIPSGSVSATTLLEALGQPQQVAFDLTDPANLLVALAGEHAVAAYSTSNGGVVRRVDDLYTTQEKPHGVWPLLNGNWLVAGDGIGVDVVTPGSHVRSAEDTQTTQAAQQISRLCLSESF